MVRRIEASAAAEIEIRIDRRAVTKDDIAIISHARYLNIATDQRLSLFQGTL